MTELVGAQNAGKIFDSIEEAVPGINQYFEGIVVGDGKELQVNVYQTYGGATYWQTGQTSDDTNLHNFSLTNIYKEDDATGDIKRIKR